MTTAARRSGITLTEILIAILIMGVGLISLATLFPLGLIRLREGTRQGRAGTTFESAADDIDSRALFFKPSFLNTWYGTRDPFAQDALPNGTYYNPSTGVGLGVIASGSVLYPANNVGLTSGLPICYDPLWRSITGVVPPLPPQVGSAPPGTTLFDQTLDFDASYVTGFDEARFGAGVFGTNYAHPYIAADPGGVSTVPSAHGLQRLTNFVPWSSALLTPQYSFTCTNLALAASSQPPDVAGNVFTSVDDIVYGADVAKTSASVYALPSDMLVREATSSSPILPDMSTGSPQADYRFTWFFTGRQLDANGNGTQFTGDVVVCDGRPFGFDPLPGGGGYAPTGETVVEGVYGYLGNSKSVLLRWNSALADPQIRVGGWICDTTYERIVTTYANRVGTTLTSFVRSSWYQVVKRVDPGPDPVLGSQGYRSMVVTLSTPVKYTTPINTSTGDVYHRNTALIMPSVVNVFPRSFEVH